jgi:hypothetical protein
MTEQEPQPELSERHVLFLLSHDSTITSLLLQECCNPGTNSVSQPGTLKYLSVYQVPRKLLQASGQVRVFFYLPSCGADILQLYGVWAI